MVLKKERITLEGIKIMKCKNIIPMLSCLSILFGVTACQTIKHESLRTGDSVSIEDLAGKWTQEKNETDVVGEPLLRRIYVTEYLTDFPLRVKWTTYRVGLFGHKHKEGESFAAYTLSDSILTVKDVAALGSRSKGAITNNLHFWVMTTKSNVSIDGDILTETRIEHITEQDGKVMKQVTAPSTNTWKRYR